MIIKVEEKDNHNEDEIIDYKLKQIKSTDIKLVFILAEISLSSTRAQMISIWKSGIQQTVKVFS